MNRNWPVLILFSSLFCATYAEQRVVLFGNDDALALAIRNLSQQQRDALNNLTISFEKIGTLSATPMGRKRQIIAFDVHADYFLEKISGYILKARLPESPQIQLHVEEINVSYFVAIDVGAVVPEVRIGMRYRFVGVPNSICGEVVSGKRYVVWLSLGRHPKTQLYFSEAVYRALILTMLQAANATSVEMNPHATKGKRPPCDLLDEDVRRDAS